jgi:hypothetical protein
MLRLGTISCGILAYLVERDPWGWTFTGMAAVGAFLWVTAPASERSVGQK